ncbi:Protein-methionine-sulfoxide reductase heme-binding subunit MsrQ [compost metagenome]
MRYRAWRSLVFLLALLPASLWAYQAWVFDLGADPGKALVDRLGLAALSFLLITLATTPLQRLTRWGGWVAVRRQLGLWCFTYATLHISGYAIFLLGLDLQQLLIDFVKRPYIFVGAVAFLGLLPLALTSNRYSVRRLGRRWKALHRLVYAILCLVLLHMLWVVRADLGEWAVYAAIGAGLLLLRTPPITACLSRLHSSSVANMTKKFQ